MKRIGMLVAVGAILLGSALPARAQFSLGDGPSPRTPAYTVNFNGQLRFIGVAWDNLNDMTDTKGTAFKDSRAQYFERLRWWLTLESADKKAKIVWNAQVGDLTFGNGNGVSDTLGSTNPGGGSTSRVGTNAGGAEGARGVNMQQRQIYIAFEPWIPNTQLVVGIQYFQFLDGPSNEFFATNSGGIRFDMTMDPISLQVYGLKLSENDITSADDNDLYGARIGVNVTPDIRLTLEGLVGNWQCFQRRPLPAGTTGGANTTLSNKGSCVDSSFGDVYWLGGTVNAKIAGMTLYGAVVYGQRPLYSNDLNKTFRERGWGMQLTAVVPLPPLTVIGHGWYTSGDKHRIAGNGPNISGTPCVKQKGGVVVGPGSGEDCSLEANSTRLNHNSDKLPVPEPGSSWGSQPYIADFLTGNNTVGGPTGLGQPFNADVTGTWGVGAAVKFDLTPALNLNLGVGFVGASETSSATGGSNSFFGDHVIEIDAGPRWTINTNLSMQVVGAYMIPDKGDNAWAGIYRFIYFF